MGRSKKIILLDIDDTLFDTQRFIDSQLIHYSLYKEVPGVLEVLSAHVFLGILSQGDSQLQMTKLQNTNIASYFSPKYIHIVEQKSLHFIDIFSEYSEMDEIIFVDDRLEHLVLAKRNSPTIIAVWMKRGRYLQAKENANFVPDYIITNLDELVPLVV